MMRRATLLILLFTAASPAPEAQVVLERVFSGSSFSRPTDLQHDAEGRLYVVEQRGVVRVFDGEEEVGVFLDIEDRVGEANLEGGLLSLAFHPAYEANGYVFVHYVAVGPRRNVIARFTRSSEDPVAVDHGSETAILEIEQPEFNHNGGTLAFGLDNYLYIAIGDGSCCGDPFQQAQDITTLLGTILRIDVDNPVGGQPYGIPSDNPFASEGGPARAELYAWGFRSPWRMSHDFETGDLWVGDVGQDRWEEVSRIALGSNAGWPVVEGSHCFDPPTNCSDAGLTLPVWEYGRDQGRSVTGGYVYRGTQIPELAGQYVYGDFVSGRIWALDYDPQTDTATNMELLDTELLVGAFGVDAEGELYVLNYGGTIHRVTRDGVSTEPAAPASGIAFRAPFPNPFASTTTLTFELAEAGSVRLAVYDVLGREVAVLHDGPAPAGEQTVRFEAEGHAPGVYVARMMLASGETAAQTLTLVR